MVDYRTRNFGSQSWPLEYLSNALPGRPEAHVAAFRDADLEGRRKMAKTRTGLRRLTIWQLHEVGTIATQEPKVALPHAELGLEMASSVSDEDLLSWGHSELGNLFRLLRNASAEEHLDMGVKLARNPYQKANALQKRGLLGLVPFDIRSAEIALPFMEQALEISPTGEARIDSDRGHSVVLSALGLVRYYLGHIDTAIKLYHEVLETACPRHGKRAHRASVITLASIHVNFSRAVDPRVLETFKTLAKSRSIKTDSLLGAMIQWILIYDDIRNDGYDWNKRRRLLTVREHLLGHEAWDRAASLTLCIAAFDAKHGMRAMQFLKKPKSLEILRKGLPGGTAFVSTLHPMKELTVAVISELAEGSGAGTIVANHKNHRPLEYLSNFLPGRPEAHVAAFRDADLEGRRRMAKARTGLRRLTIWQLHEAGTLATQEPKVARPHAELGLEMAKSVSDEDLLSWGNSELGNVLRLLRDPNAEKYLDKGVRLAVSPYQKANALQKRGILGLVPFDIRSAEIALPFMERALEISPTGEARIDSDRGHSVVLSSLGLVRYYLGHIDTAIELYHQVLKTACPRHGKRARRASVITLASIHVNFSRSVDPAILEQFRGLSKSRSIPANSLLGAMIQWVLIYDDIKKDGYDRNKRRRLLTVRGHLIEHDAWDRAASLTLWIATLDSVHGMRAFHFLKKAESTAILIRGLDRGKALVSSLQRMADGRTTDKLMISLARRAGLGDVEHFRS